MANRRMLARNVATSKKLSKVSFEAECLWHRGLPFLDDAGCATADPEEFRAIVIPMGKDGEPIPLDTVANALEELARVGLIELCECEEQVCLRYTNFEKFQTFKSDRERKIECPKPSGFQRNPLVSLKLSEVKIREDMSWNPTESDGFHDPSPTKKKDKVWSPGEDPYDLAVYLRELMLQNNPNARVPELDSALFQKWCRTFDLMERIDGRDPCEVAAVIEWCQKDDFWMTNILSPDKLRKQYDKLYLTAKKEGACLYMPRGSS